VERLSVPLYGDLLPGYFQTSGLARAAYRDPESELAADLSAAFDANLVSGTALSRPTGISMLQIRHSFNSSLILVPFQYWIIAEVRLSDTQNVPVLL
jgi:hypothetical protein